MRNTSTAKGITDTPATMTLVKSAKGGRLRSAPKTEANSYLDLFVAHVERLRLSQEQTNLGKRKAQIETRMRRNQKRLDEISAALRSGAQRVVDEETAETPVSRPADELPSKKWRTVAADY